MRAIGTVLGSLLGSLLGLLLLATPAGAVDFPDDSGFTAEQRREIEQTVASSTDPLEVRILEQLPRNSYGSAQVAASRILETVDDFRAQVVVWGGPDALPAFGIAGDGEAYCGVQAVRGSEFDDHQQFVELVRLVAAGTGCQAMDEALAKRWSERDGLPSGGPVAEPADATTWLIRGLVIVVGLALLGALVFFRGRAIRDAWQRKRRGQALTGFASEATRRSAAEQAHTDLLAFGEELDATELKSGHRLGLWQLALDAYDEASRLYDRPHDRPHDRRVIELCASGREHLARATRAKAD